MNLSARIESSLLPERRGLLRLVADEAAARGLPLYAVGGFARDLWLGRRVRDVDLVLEGDAIPFARALARAHGGRVTVHSKFHTATWFLPETFGLQPFDIAQGESSTLDLISARSETYEHPAALPTVRLGTLADDLRRRDFTINALAVRLDGEHFGELRDDLGGLSDLERGLIRVLHPRSLIDDPTRIFRAARYAVRYRFQLAPDTAALIPAALPYVNELSPERLRHELDLVFEEEDAVPILAQLAEMGIFESVKPALPWDEATRVRMDKTRSHFRYTPRAASSEGECCRDGRWMAWLIGLSSKEIHAIAKRLHFTADLKKKTLAASSILADLDAFRTASPSECVARFDSLPEDAVRVASLCAPRGRARSNLNMYLSKWKTMKPFANGETLKALGVPPGPRYKEILSRLRAAWVDGEVTSDEEENRLLREWLRPGG